MLSEVGIIHVMQGMWLFSHFVFADSHGNCSISVSENRWTDCELGTLWLEKDFEPVMISVVGNSLAPI